MSDGIIGARTSGTRFVTRLYSSDDAVDATSRHATRGPLFFLFPNPKQIFIFYRKQMEETDSLTDFVAL